MKRSLLFSCILFVATSIAHAHQQPPIASYLPAAENAFVARVTSVSPAGVTFAATEVLKGKPASRLTLEPYLGDENYSLGSEWLLVSCTPHGWGQNSVGWAMKGDCAWIPATVVRTANQTYIIDWASSIPASMKNPFGIAWDVTPDGRRCLTLDHVKQLLKTSATKP